ncbi:hypothetical protein PHLGIDRAFT_154642 [Phlebiopsis gigantea 11061_1 CR5-6]|uniref:Uncharacterized protein n=1 Tax=Phlebiopsis gigantea (strain 11061_1 CR5-6) TaxID=745531 RepID=A0A0C3NK59_PHLG1|nr:hypothetical protein PHLGIDRAFT_154642 [Phlebiopsis gigantea 11061_1 CR5-6]
MEDAYHLRTRHQSQPQIARGCQRGLCWIAALVVPPRSAVLLYVVSLHDLAESNVGSVRWLRLSRRRRPPLDCQVVELRQHSRRASMRQSGSTLVAWCAPLIQVLLYASDFTSPSAPTPSVWYPSMSTSSTALFDDGDHTATFDSQLVSVSSGFGHPERLRPLAVQIRRPHVIQR